MLEPAELRDSPPPALLDKVEAWRLQRLLEGGYPIPIAERLATRVDVDLHRAVELVGRGCAPELAGRILL